MIVENFWFDGDIGNIPGVNLSKLATPLYYDGNEVISNNKTYKELCTEIDNEVYALTEDIGGQGFDAVDEGEMQHARQCVESVFNKCAEIIKNTESRVSSASTTEEIDKLITNFKYTFVEKVMFSAENSDIPSRMYLSNEAYRGVFTRDSNMWALATKSKIDRTGDNGGYRLMGQFIDRLYKIFTTTRDKVIALCNEKKRTLAAGTDKGNNPKGPSTPSTPSTPEAPKTIEQKIRSLVTQKNRLAQKQASLIKTIRELTSEARTLYVRQFLNEDEAASAKGSAEQPVTPTSSEQPPAKTPAAPTGEKQPPAKTKEVDSNDPLYIGLTELINTKNRIEAYYNTSKNYFKNNIAKRAKYLQSLMSGELRSNMSAEDRVKVFNNHNYDYDSTDTQGENGTPNATTTPTASVTTQETPSSDATDQGTTPTQTPTTPVQPTTPNPIRATTTDVTPPTNNGKEKVPGTPATQNK